MRRAGAAQTIRIDGEHSWPLYLSNSSRQIEARAQAELPSHTLMQRAGLAIAQLALALAPHSQRIWIACGPGNNGGDGLEAALHLHAWGKTVQVTWLGSDEQAPPDCRQSLARIRKAGMVLSDQAPQHWDLAIDALLGLGCNRPPESTMADWLRLMHSSRMDAMQVEPSGSTLWASNPRSPPMPGCKAARLLCQRDDTTATKEVTGM